MLFFLLRTGPLPNSSQITQTPRTPLPLELPTFPGVHDPDATWTPEVQEAIPISVLFFLNAPINFFRPPDFPISSPSDCPPRGRRKVPVVHFKPLLRLIPPPFLHSFPTLASSWWGSSSGIADCEVQARFFCRLSPFPSNVAPPVQALLPLSRRGATGRRLGRQDLLLPYSSFIISPQYLSPQRSSNKLLLEILLVPYIFPKTARLPLWHCY